jgi:hypothetical protein
MGQQASAGNPPLQQASASTNATIQPFYVGGGASADQYNKMLGTEYGSIAGNTTNRFSDMFSKYVDVANTEANRQASQIGETLGSRGALYSSANLQQQADLRQKTSSDIANTAAQYQTQLEQQRQSAMGQVLQGQAGLASGEMGAREAAMTRAYQDFLRRSDVPPFASTGVQIGASRPSGGTYAS